ncbi:TRAP transporter large permease [Hyphomicrobium sulfonivorans]|uniref:TRAP transporter large permease n=1 Tax=Hyphomicrobium sulfonivorans TaxID=121290 RepID=UPI00156E510B|nr:TRAP transporter large permease subunit [Hyphomicrobium sulfonivorans]MBI1649453.1 TRAP transporter large permease subunit [Hyphomicrobium sulfonivorans]NSL71370.1 C4-dicarboxylate ABC transporter [Hyphomicrobium sulfonivorans]
MLPFIAENLAPIMFAALVLFLLLGYPAAFSLAAVGLVFFVIGVELAPYSGGAINLSWPLLGTMPERIFGVMTNDTLLAIPFFAYMGLILERSGMAEDLLETVGQLFGSVRGGLAFAVIFVGALLAATTGVVAASVISMGLISLPIMMRYGYDRRFSAGTIAASGTLAQIFPPSLVLIVLADQLGRSVGDMYTGALVPALILTSLYATFAFAVAFIWKSAAPGLPVEAIRYRQPDGSRGSTSLVVLTSICAVTALLIMLQTHYRGADFVVLTMTLGVCFAVIVAGINWLLRLVGGPQFLSSLAEHVVFVMVPPLLLIFLVLGTIFIGVATPTEGGAMGAVGAMLLALGKRYSEGNRARFNFEIMRSAAQSTAKLSAFVMFILIGARIFSLTFYGVNGHLWVEHLLTSLPGGEVGFLIFVNILVFFLAFFLDFFELAFIIVPLLAPAAEALGIDLIWFGVILAVNMQTSFMHPPFGFALFYLRSVAPRAPYIDKVTGQRMPPVTTAEIYWGALPYLCIQLFVVALLIAFPGLVRHDPPPSAHRPAAVTAPGGAAPAFKSEGFHLPPYPPSIPGAPPPDTTGPGAPTLDMSVPPDLVKPGEVKP